MDIEKMIEQFRAAADKWEAGHQIILTGELRVQDALRDAATALSTLQDENAQLRGKLEYEQEHANAYYEECGQWEAENEKMRAELEQVKRERDAAVADVCAIIGEVEEIRRGYGVDNADADDAFAGLCESYCAKNGHGCYKKGSNGYYCANFKWRGPQKED